MFNTSFRTCGAASLLLLLAPLALLAGVVTSNPTLPPDQGAYLTPTDVHTLYPAGNFPEVILKNVMHSGFLNVSRSGCDAGTPPPCNENEHFDSTVSGLVSVGGSPFMPFSLSGPVHVQSIGYNPSGVPFNTEMISMDLSGTVGGNPVMIRESPTLQSTGVTSVTPLGGGMYQINSFFDVFTDISLDGGFNWDPSSGPSHVELESIPEPATCALIGGGLLAMGLLRRRK